MTMTEMHTPGVKWKVFHQEEEPTLDAEGRQTTIHHIHFRTEHGHESSVSLPDHLFTAHNVAREIHAKAREIGQVHELTSETVTKPAQQ